MLGLTLVGPARRAGRIFHAPAPHAPGGRLGDPLADVARTYLLFWLSGHVAAAEKYMALACEALKVKLPDVQKWPPIVAAAESSRDQTPKNHELLVHWASVVDIE